MQQHYQTPRNKTGGTGIALVFSVRFGLPFASNRVIRNLAYPGFQKLTKPQIKCPQMVTRRWEPSPGLLIVPESDVRV